MQKKKKSILLGEARVTKNFSITTKLKIDNTELEMVNSYKYLGLTLNANLNLEQHFKNIGMVSAKLNTITHLKKYVKTRTLLLTYKTAIRPIIEYANFTHSLLTKTLNM